MELDYYDPDLGPVVRFQSMFTRAAEKCANAEAKPLFESMRDGFNDAVTRAMKGEFAKKTDPVAAICKTLGDVSKPLDGVLAIAEKTRDDGVWDHYEDILKSIQYFGKGVVDGLAKIEEVPSEKIELLRRIVLRQPSP